MKTRQGPSHKRRSCRQVSNTRGRQALAEKSTDASRRKVVQPLSEKTTDASRRKRVQGSLKMPVDLPAKFVNAPPELPSRSLTIPILDLDFTLSACSSEQDLSASSVGVSTPHALTDSALLKSEQLLSEMLATIGVESPKFDRKRISLCLSTDGQDDADATDPQKPTSEVPTTVEVPIALFEKLTETWSKYRELEVNSAGLSANDTDFKSLERDLASLHYAASLHGSEAVSLTGFDASSCCSTGAPTPLTLPSPSSLTSVSSWPQSQAASCNSPTSPISRMALSTAPCHFFFESPCRANTPCRTNNTPSVSLHENSKAANMPQATVAPTIQRHPSLSAVGLKSFSQPVLQGSVRAPPTPSRQDSAGDAVLWDPMRAAQSPSRKHLALHALQAPPMPIQLSSSQAPAGDAVLHEVIRAAQSPSRKQLALHALQPPIPIQFSPSQRGRALRLVSRTTIDTYM